MGPEVSVSDSDRREARSRENEKMRVGAESVAMEPVSVFTEPSSVEAS